MDPLLSELGQSLPLSEEQLEQVRGETSAALYVPQTQLLQPNTHTSDYRANNTDNTVNCRCYNVCFILILGLHSLYVLDRELSE